MKVIPLGSTNKTIPVEQIASLDDNFKLDIKSFFWGIIFTMIGLSIMASSFIGELILSIYSVLTILSSFQTKLNVNLTSGNVHDISVVVFEKSKLLSCKDTIEQLIQHRYNDTNVTANTDRIIEHLKK